jgi:hypothetical protein
MRTNFERYVDQITQNVIPLLNRRIGRGAQASPQIFKVGQLSRNPCVIRVKHITLIQVDKKNRGLQLSD